MNQELAIYKFKDHNVSVIQDGKGEPWWIAREICDILEIVNPIRSIANLDADEKGIHNVNTPGGKQNVKIISESGLYKLTLRSRKPQAKEFQNWVTREVLPSIRKTGAYVANTGGTTLQALQATVAVLVEHDKRITAIEAKQQQIAAVVAPVKEVSTRMKISQIVRNYADKAQLDFKTCWDKLYYEFKYRYSIDLKQRAINSGKSKLDIAEELGCLDDLFALAITLFVGNN